MQGGTRSRQRNGGRLPALALGLTLTAGIGLTGCSPEPNPDAVVRVAVSEPGTLLPASATNPTEHQILATLFTPLVGYDSDGLPYPWAAESIVPGPDHRTWTIRLREGYTFHNGEPVTSDRYLAAWNYAAYQPNQQPNHYYFENIAGYEQLRSSEGDRPTATTMSGLTKIDELTFTVALRQPSGEFATMLGAPAFYPLPAAAFHPDGRLVEDFPTTPVGNGPFQVRGGWQRGQYVEVARYDDYPGERPRIGGLTFVNYGDPGEAYADLRAGELDLITEIPTEQYASAVAELGDRLLRPVSTAGQFLAFPSYQPQWQDPRLRKAVSMALDRDRLTRELFHGARVSARSFVPPKAPGARPDTCGTACQFDPDAARELYRQAEGPETLTISFNTERDHQPVMAAVCAQLHEHLGVSCQAEPAGRFGELVSALEERKPVGLLRMGWSQDYPSMASYLGPLFTSSGTANLPGYRNPEVDTLVRSGVSASTEAEALAAYQHAESMVAEDLPLIPLWFDRHTLAHSPRLHGVTVTSADQVDLRRLEVIE